MTVPATTVYSLGMDWLRFFLEKSQTYPKHLMQLGQQKLVVIWYWLFNQESYKSDLPQ
jgi:hypothetical protein